MKYLFALVGIALVGALIFEFGIVDDGKVNIRVGDASINVDLADTDNERRQGLSGKEELKFGEGLLFIFDRPGMYGFWMKDMNFAIDIVWIGDDKKVIGIERSVNPSTFPTVFYPPSDVVYVLEVPATFSDTTNIKVGQSLLVGE